MLEVKGLTKTFGKTVALDDVSFDIGDKGLYVIIGESGSGKSTIFNILTGALRADGGEISFNGDKLSEGINPDGIFGVIFQDGNLLGGLTVEDNLSIVSSDAEKNGAILERLGMSAFRQRKADKLSGGEKQRVAIARALASDCRILLADEPTGSLDGKNGENVMRLLKEVSQEKPVILITHNVDFANRYADGILRLKKGRIVSLEGAFDSSPQINDEGENDGQVAVPDTDKTQANEKNAPEERRLSGRIKTRFSFWKSYDKILKNLTSVLILGIIFILVALSVSVSVLDVNGVYVDFLQGYDNAVLESGKDFGEFREKTEGKSKEGLTTVYPYSWRKGGSSYIVADDSLKDGEIKLGYRVAEEYNSTLLTDVKEGDDVDFDGTTFVMAGVAEKGNYSRSYDLDNAVYLNDATATRFLDSQPFRIAEDDYGVTLTFLKDDSLSGDQCVLGFNLYYLLGSKDPDYIGFAKTRVEFELMKNYVIMCTASLDIVNVVPSADELVFELYVSEEKYVELCGLTRYYFYSLDPSDGDIVEYWIGKGIMPKGEYFESYTVSKGLEEKVYPICASAATVFAVLAALYAFAVAGHVCKINGKELFVLKTLRVNSRDLTALIILQTVPVAIIAMIFGSFASFGIVQIVIKSAERFFEPPSGAGILVSLAISAISLAVASVVRTYRLNKKFSPSFIRD